MYGAYEVVTYGGGTLYRDMFTAVALMSGTSSMSSLIRLALMLGLVLGLLKAVFDTNIGALLKWFIMAAIIYGVLLVPKVQIHVTDKFNAGLAGADVANVPLGVAFVASVTSQIGDRAIQMTETAFGDPDDLKYSKTGMIYGAKVFQQLSDAQITNPLFDENMQTFVRSCVYYDVLTNQYTVGDLAKSNDLWSFVTTSPNAGRSMSYNNGAGTAPTLMTCAQGAQALNGQWNDEITASLKMQERRLRPDLAEGQLTAAATSELETLQSFVFASSQSAQNTMRQMLMVNALRRGMAGFAADAGGSASDVLAQTQADVQTRNTQSLMGSVAEKGIVILKIVVDLLFIGIFPVLFPAFLLPKLGPMMIKGYFSGFLYLQLWGPMYVILHKIMNVQMAEKTAAAAYMPGTDLGLKLGNLSSIHSTNADLAAVAGMMTLMIPVLAAAVTKGAMAVGGAGESLMNSYRSGAEAAGSAAATGNFSFGNTSLDNHSFNNVSGNRHVTSAFNDNGNTSWVDGDLNTHTLGASGGYRLDASRSSPAVDMRMSQGVSSAATQQASNYREAGQAVDRTWSAAQSRTQSEVSDVATAWASGRDWNSRVGEESRRGMSNMVSDMDSTSQSLQRRFGLSETDAKSLTARAAVEAAAEAQLGLKVFGTGLDGSLRTSAGLDTSRSKSTSTDTQLQAARDELSSRQFSNKVENQTSNYAQQSWGENSSYSNTYRQVNADTFSSAQSVADSRRQFENEGQRWDERADYARTNSANLESSYQQQFTSWAHDRLLGTTDAYGARIDEQRFGQIMNPSGSNAVADRQILDSVAQSFFQEKAGQIDVPQSVQAGPPATQLTPLEQFEPSDLGRPDVVRPSGPRREDSRPSPASVPAVDQSGRASIAARTGAAADVVDSEMSTGMTGSLFTTFGLGGHRSAWQNRGMGTQAKALDQTLEAGESPQAAAQAAAGAARLRRP